MASALALAACGSSSKTSGSKPSASASTSSTAAQSTAPAQGVTANSVKLGIVMVNYDSIKDFIDFTRGNQQQAYQVFVDDINKHGGVAGGKKIIPYFRSYTPIGSTGPVAACTALTQDSKVFATIGVLIDSTGSAQLCFTKNAQTVLITHELSQEEIAQSPPGLLLTPDITADRRLDVTMALLKKNGTLKGKTVAILAETGTQNRIGTTIKPDLDKIGVKQGSTAVITTGSNIDTTQAQQQLDSFIERWKTEGVNAVVISGQDIVSKQFIQKLRDGLPGVLLITDSQSSAKEQGADITNAHQSPNPYAGILTANGLTDQQTFETPSVQQCVKTYEAATGTTVVAPDDLKPGADGKRAEIYQTVEDSCGDLTFFKLIADKVGANLNNANWTATVATMGTLNGKIVGGKYASLGNGKFDADNGFALAKFDAAKGDFVDITPITDTAKIRF